MVDPAPAPEPAFTRGARRLDLAEYIGLVASCQAAIDAAMAALPPAAQVELWNALHPETFLPSSGRRMLWVLRRGVLDDLAPHVEDFTGQPWRPAATANDQMVFRAVLEALATGRRRLGEITEFCNEIHAWPSVQGVAGYLAGRLAAAVQLAMAEAANDQEARGVQLPSWALVGTLLDAIDGKLDTNLTAYTAVLATVLGPEGGRLTGGHARVLAALYRATGDGRQLSAPASALRARLQRGARHPVAADAPDDGFHALLRDLQALQLVQTGPAAELRWTALTLVHLPPGQAAGVLTWSPGA